MAVPKQKVFKSRRNKRRAHYSLKPASFLECSNYGKLMHPHHIWAASRHYDDREVVLVSAV